MERELPWFPLRWPVVKNSVCFPGCWQQRTKSTTYIHTSVLQQLAAADAFLGSYKLYIPTTDIHPMWYVRWKQLVRTHNIWYPSGNLSNTENMNLSTKLHAPTYKYYLSKLRCPILTRSIFIHFDIISIPLCSINLFLFIFDRIRITHKRKFLAFLKIIFFFLFYFFTPIYCALLTIYVDYDYPTKLGQRWSTTLLPA